MILQLGGDVVPTDTPAPLCACIRPSVWPIESQCLQVATKSDSLVLNALLPHVTCRSWLVIQMGCGCSSAGSGRWSSEQSERGVLLRGVW
jgi:hypothetical protein